MTDKTEGVKAPLNPLYEAMPFIYKRTGDVKRCRRAGRFSRTLAKNASFIARNLQDAKSVTVSDDNTTYILSRANTAILLNDPEGIEAMIINGWEVVATNIMNEGFVTDLMTQKDMFNDR